ncbi:MAG: DUF4476 domain-containing protein [Proteobacteria bacterium]|jgi:hypothetical protein|nr:DUF4476 domain-containing protein [Pseudomonadota bacterium]
MSRVVVLVLSLTVLACAGMDGTGPFPAEDGSTVYMDGNFRTTLDPLTGFVWLGPPDGTAKYGFDGQTIVEAIAGEWHVTINQVVAIVKVMGSHENEIRAVEILIPKVVDSHNVHQLVSAMGSLEGAKKVVALFP